MMLATTTALLLLVLILSSSSSSILLTDAFVFPTATAFQSSTTTTRSSRPVVLALAATTNSNNKCTPLPAGLSPFTKSESKGLDLQGTFRKIAAMALFRAVQDISASTSTSTKATCFEVEFPPLAGGDSSKSQFDDFDNVSELNANADWCVQWAPMVQTSLNFESNNNNNGDQIWLVFPDDKECELAKKQWTGQRYRQSAKFTSIRAAVSAVTTTENVAVASSSSSLSQKSNNKNDDKPLFAKAWGSSFASAIDKLQGGDGILADSSTLDELDVNNVYDNDKSNKRLHIVCQPGNGGPVEDWINVQTLHTTSSNSNKGGMVMTCIVNGALDKVRDGYYPAIFFPALAKASKSFYQSQQAVQTIFYLKPITDKGLYGWLFHVYGEPWQVILQTATQKQQRDGTVRTVVQDTTALLSAKRPTYQEAVQALVKTALKMNYK